MTKNDLPGCPGPGRDEPAPLGLGGGLGSTNQARDVRRFIGSDPESADLFENGRSGLWAKELAKGPFGGLADRWLNDGWGGSAGRFQNGAYDSFRFRFRKARDGIEGRSGPVFGNGGMGVRREEGFQAKKKALVKAGPGGGKAE